MSDARRLAGCSEQSRARVADAQDRAELAIRSGQWVQANAWATIALMRREQEKDGV